jgi:hypothetical protein
MIVSAAILSCGPNSILLVNLHTNDLRYCPVNRNLESCIQRLLDLGYVRADRLSTEQKASLGLLPHY